MESVQIVSSSNDNYAKHMGVMLNSLLANKDDKTQINISIIDGDISQNNKSKLKCIASRYNATLEFISIDKTLFSDIKTKKMRFKSKDSYYKIYTPELLSKDIQKAIYLDCDLIVKEDITKLWNTNIDKYHLGAVKDKIVRRKLGFKEDTVFFNSGVMLLNLRIWRKNNISAHVLQYIKENSDLLNTLEQEALNVILHNEWLQLDLKWNYTTAHLKEVPGLEPAIIHYTGRSKPWNHGHPLQEEYFKYLKTAHWD